MEDGAYVNARFNQVPENLYMTAKDKLDIPPDAENVEVRREVLNLASNLYLWKAKLTFRYLAVTMKGSMAFGRVYPKAAPPSPERSGPTVFCPDLASCHYTKDVLPIV